MIDGAMARAIWRGAISFGLVTIPVQLVSAVGRQRPRFHLLHEKDESPVRYDRVCQRESRAVPWDQIVKGFEVEKGRYTVLTKEDFRKAAVERSDAIDVLTFVEHDAIDPRFFETPYYCSRRAPPRATRTRCSGRRCAPSGGWGWRRSSCGRSSTSLRCG